jgi:hypothetical protein
MDGTRVPLVAGVILRQRRREFTGLAAFCFVPADDEMLVIRRLKRAYYTEKLKTQGGRK